MISKLKKRLLAHYESLDYFGQIKFVGGITIVCVAVTWMASGNEYLNSYLDYKNKTATAKSDMTKIRSIPLVSKPEMQKRRIAELSSELERINSELSSHAEFDFGSFVKELPKGSKIETHPSTDIGGIKERRLSISFSCSWEEFLAVSPALSGKYGIEPVAMSIKPGNGTALDVLVVMRAFSKDDVWERLQ